MKHNVPVQRLMRTAILSVIILSALQVNAQQPFNYTQYMQNLTPYNSAYALLNAAASVNVLGRRQWVGVDGAPSTFLFNWSFPAERIGATAGLIAVQDKFAAENITEVSAFIAKAVQLTENDYLSASFNAGIRNYTANYSALDPMDPKFSDDIRETIGTVGLGVMLYNADKYYIGASLPRLSIRSLGKASEEDNRFLRNSYYFSGAYLQPLGKNVKVKPAALISYTRGLPALYDFSATFFLLDQVGMGLNYRTSNEIAGILSFLFKSNIRAGYSYQVNTGTQRIGNAGNGTHELSVGYYFGKGIKSNML